MKKITSKDNSIYKAVCKLAKRKYREQTGKYLLEGIKPLADAMSLGIPVEMILIRENSSSGFEESEHTPVMELSARLFDSLADTDHSQGVIAVVRKTQHDWDSFSDLLKENTKNIVILDRLQDPGNMGTIIRTAEAAGYGGVLLMDGCTDVYAPKVVRAAAGSLFRMPILQENDIAEATDRLHALQRNIAVTSLEAEQYYQDADLGENVALVIGNEGRGVRQEFLDIADIKINIPMAGSIESLNAAVAAGILMYQSHNIK